MRQAETQEINILTKKLDEVCFIEFGTRVVQKKDGGAIYPVYGGGGATFKMDTYNRENCLVVSRFAMSKQCTRFVEGKFFLNDSGLTVRPKNEKELSQSYLDYLLLTLNDTIYSLSRGTAQRNLNVPKFRNLEISYPDSVELQLHIANILSKAENLIAQRKEGVRLLDEFLKSTFLEMFGDPSNNKKKFQRGKIRDVVTEVKYGTSSPAKDKGEYPYLRMNNITFDGYMDYSKLRYFDTTSEKEKEKYSVKKGDLLFNRTNSKELVGKTGVFNEDTEMIIAGYLIRVRTNEKANPWFLWGYLNSVHGKQTLLGMCKSIVGMANINAQELQRIKILIPPIELQIQFAHIVEKTEALKSHYQQSLQELENLYGSLSQRAFKGELVVAQPVKRKQANISDKALLAFYQKQIIGHVIKKHQEHKMEQGEMILAKDLYHLEALYGIKTHFQFKNWHYGTYDNKIRQLINGKDKFFMKKSVGQKGFQVLALGEKSEALFDSKYVKPELEYIDKAMDELLNIYATFPFKQRSHKIELLNTVCKAIVDGKSMELSKVREIMKQWKTTKAGFKNKAEKFSERETLEMIELIISKGWDKKLFQEAYS